MMQCGLAVKGLILTKIEVKVALSFVRGSLTWNCEGTGFRGESGIGRVFFSSLSPGMPLHLSTPSLPQHVKLPG